MTKQRLFLGALGLVLALAIPLFAGPSAAEWEQTKKDFYRDFANADMGVKKTALERVAAVNTVDAAKLLIAIYGGIKREADAKEAKLQAEIDDLENTLKPLRKAQGSLQSGEAARKAKLEAEVKVASDAITKIREEAKTLLDVIASAIGKFTDPAAVSELRALVIKGQDWADRYAVLAGLIAAKAQGVGSLCLEAAKDPDPRVRILALDALLDLGDIKAAEPLFVKAVEDPAHWQIRLSGIAGVEKLRSKDGMAAMIRQLKKEDGRLRDDISGALKRLIGMDFGYDAVAWENWWKTNGEKWDGKPIGGGAPPSGNEKSGGGAGGTTAEPPTFFGLKITSKKIVFVLDISGSMNDPSVPPEGADKPPPVVSGGGNGPAPAPWEPGKKGTKLEVLKYEFEKTMNKLHEKTTFNIIVFSDNPLQWKDKMQTATPPIKAEAIDFVNKQAGNGMTNTGDSLEKAFELAGQGLKDKSYAALVDTIYLMTDGMPCAGKWPTQDEVVKKVKEWNSLSKVIINCVALGDKSNYNQTFLNTLASMTGGICVKR
ncbi:MAG: hypothetical protein FD180_4326 [Planctomycetota bacterium]|nr:MAG: hypothetical protein FD180_4326 [Planctomycetota bacterium]